MQLQRWARDANGNQKRFKLQDGGGNANNVTSLELVAALLVK